MSDMKISSLIIASLAAFLIACGGGGSSSGSGSCSANIAGSQWVGTKTYDTGYVGNFDLYFFANGTGLENNNNSVTWTAAGNNVTWRKNIEDGNVVNTGVVNCNTLTGSFKQYDIAGPLTNTGTLKFSRVL